MVHLGTTEKMADLDTLELMVTLEDKATRVLQEQPACLGGPDLRGLLVTMVYLEIEDPRDSREFKDVLGQTHRDGGRS